MRPLGILGATLGCALLFTASALLPLFRPSVMPAGEHGCFGGQPDSPHALAAVRASVQIWVGRPGHGGYPIGSGVVLSGASPIVMTAQHVAPGWASGLLHAVDYTGRDLGLLRVTRTGNQTLVPGGAGALLGDISVLEEADPSAGLLAGVAGLPLSERRSSGVLFMRFDSPSGPDVGSSGAAIVDSRGEVAGILTHSASQAMPRRFLINYGGLIHHRRTAPLAGWGYADPLSDEASGETLPISVGVVASHPWGNCVLHKVRFMTFDGDRTTSSNRILAPNE